MNKHQDEESYSLIIRKIVDTYLMEFTWQDVLLALAPKATASLSLLGSSWILIE